MCQKSSIPLHIRTDVPVSTDVGQEILNLAVRGSCDAWAVVSEIQPLEENSPVCASARFSVRTNPDCSLVMDSADVLRGVELMLSGGYNINLRQKRALLTALVCESAGELDHQMAGSIMMAAMSCKSHGKFSLPTAS